MDAHIYHLTPSFREAMLDNGFGRADGRTLRRDRRREERQRRKAAKRNENHQSQKQ